MIRKLNLYLSFRILALTFGLSILIAGQQPADKSSPLFVQQTVWKEFEDGYPFHQIDALVVSKKGILLAFNEGRIGGYDEDPKHIVLKRSTDNGATWSDDILIEKSDGEFYKKENQSRLEAWTNPAAIVDERTGRIFIFYALNEGSHDQRATRVFYRYSDDDGATWLPSENNGKRIEITRLFTDNQQGWTFFMPGPGHGIQLSKQTGANASKNGRLLMQFWNRRAVSERPRNYGLTVIYSDDNGKTWKRGSEFGMDDGMCESRLVELADGQILVNARGSDPEDNRKHEDTKKARLYATSNDAGVTFSATQARYELNFSNVDSSMISYSPMPGRNCVLFSHPADSVMRRVELTVSVSCDGAKTWSHHRLVDAGRVSYSDMTVLPDKTIGLLYGRRSSDEWLNRSLSSSTIFARFDWNWLMQDSNEPQKK